MENSMTENEKKLLLQLLLENMRGSFPLAGWGDVLMKKAYDLAIELDFKAHAERIKDLADEDKSLEFQREARNYLNYIHIYFDDWKSE